MRNMHERGEALGASSRVNSVIAAIYFRCPLGLYQTDPFSR